MTVISNSVIRVAEPHGTYYDQIYKPAIEKAGLRPVRADAEIFGAGRIINKTFKDSNTDPFTKRVLKTILGGEGSQEGSPA